MSSVRAGVAVTSLWVAIVLPFCAYAQNGAEQKPPMYYSLKRGAIVYADEEATRPYVRLGFMEPVFVLSSEGNWTRVRTQDGARGYIESRHLSNAWIRVSKSQKRLYFYRGMRLVLDFAADFGFNAYSDKIRQGTEDNPDDWRTPEGAFHVVRRNGRSQFYKAFVLNYPNAEDAERGLRDGIITERQYRAILQASDRLAEPPMSTPLGGMIEIHGDGTGKSINWTQGCVAIHNEGMDLLWDLVPVGTPVVIEK